MKGGIESYARFQDAERDIDELAHHGADDELGGLAVRGQAFAEAPAPLGFVEGNQGRHIAG